MATIGPTTSGRTQKIEPGTHVSIWGEDWNDNLDFLDAQIDGLAIIPVAAPVTLTSINYQPDQARNAILKFTGVGGFTVTAPGVFKRYILWNACTNPVTITAGGAAVIVDASDIIVVICDGVDFRAIGFNGLPLKQYIASVVLGTLSGLPAVSGNAGKVVYTDGASAFWKLLTILDVSDYASDQATKTAAATGLAVAFAVAL